MAEMQLVNDVIEYLTYCGAVAIRINAGMIQVDNPTTGRRYVIRGAPVGTSDVLCCFRGRYVAIECKIGKNKPTAAQADFIRRIQEAGGVGFAAWSVVDVWKNLTELTGVELPRPM